MNILLKAEKIDVNLRDDKHGYTPLHWAVKCGNRDAVSSLMQRGADVRAMDNDECTSSHLAILAIRDRQCSYYDIATFKGMVDDLVENGADINAVNKDRCTPLHLTAKYNRYLEADYLIGKGACVNIVNKNGSTPLHLAAKMGNSMMVSCFIKNGAYVNVVDKNGSTPLHLAAENNRVIVVEVLIRKGRADVKAVNKDGYTALHFAARNNNKEAINILMKEGANHLLKSKDCKTPVSLNTNGYIMQLLKDKALDTALVAFLGSFGLSYIISLAFLASGVITSELLSTLGVLMPAPIASVVGGITYAKLKPNTKIKVDEVEETQNLDMSVSITEL